MSARRADTRDRMIDAAIALLRQGGVARAGVNEVIAASGAPKGSMYHHFPGGKRQIVAEALTRYGDDVARYMRETLSVAPTPGGKVRALFAAVARRLEAARFAASCAAGATALDLDDELDGVRSVVARDFAAWIAIIAEHVPVGRTRQERASFAGLVLTAIEGGYVRGRAERSTAPLIAAGDWLARLADATLADAAVATRTPRRVRPATPRKGGKR